MTKKHQREIDVVERLEKENRELKATVRALQRRLKKTSKGRAKELDEEESSKEEQTEKSNKSTVNIPCVDCGKGNLKEVDLLGRVFLQCSHCGPKGKKTK